MTDEPPELVQRHLLRIAAEAAEKTSAGTDQLVRFLTAEVGHTPSDVVYTETTLELHHYEPETREHETPICLVYALVNKPYILDLQPDRSVIRHLLDAGFEVYLVEWGDPSLLDTSLGLSDYVCRYLDNCVRAACDHADTPDVHLLGYCMGGTLATLYTALDDERVRTLSAMATPVAFDDTGGVLERWASELDPQIVADTYGTVPAELLAAAFAMLDPAENLLGKYLRFFDSVENDEFVEMFSRMEQWTWDGVDVPGAVFAEFLEEIYRQNNLVSGDVRLDGQQADPRDIEVPLLQIVGAHDHIVPPEASRPLNDIVGSDDERLVEFDAGHIGISVSGKAHATLWPEVCEWYAKRSRSE